LGLAERHAIGTPTSAHVLMRSADRVRLTAMFETPTRPGPSTSVTVTSCTTRKSARGTESPWSTSTVVPARAVRPVLVGCSIPLKEPIGPESSHEATSESGAPLRARNAADPTWKARRDRFVMARRLRAAPGMTSTLLRPSPGVVTTLRRCCADSCWPPPCRTRFSLGWNPSLRVGGGMGTQTPLLDLAGERELPAA
jgi:hypothetical protein